MSNVLISSILFGVSVIGILLIFLINPLIILVVSTIKKKKTLVTRFVTPSISLITVVHNARSLVADKVNNSLSLLYPSDSYEIIIFSDGSTDGTDEAVRQIHNKRIRYISSLAHEGKNSAINRAVQQCSGEIIVFSDVDAILNSDAIMQLVTHFSDPRIGGVCGQRIILDEGKQMQGAQSDYIKFDSTIKRLESHVGSISSNDGKLYAIRKKLFHQLPPAVTDDLYTALAIIKEGNRFIFEPKAVAYIRVPSRNTMHEVQRRRRIVSGSLRGIFILKQLLNPFRYGLFSVNLFVNKVLKRFLPVILIALFLSTLSLSFYSALFKFIFALQTVFYLLALSHVAFFQYTNVVTIRKVSSWVFYFCVGNYGTLRGLIDFFEGKQITKWEPLKAD